VTSAVLGSQGRALKPCHQCGGPKTPGLARKWLCENCQPVRTRKPCARCHGVKEPGEKRNLCNSCRELTRWSRHSDVYKDKTWRNWQYLQKYGITTDDYLVMLEAQNGVCVICQREDALGTRLCVDHCHETGRVRGLLCRKCNQTLGAHNDDPGWFAAASEYLLGGDSR
jgi:hypothetical protein